MMKNMRAAKPKDKDAMSEQDGIDVHLSHEHMKKMGMDKPPAVGTKVKFQGEGEVTSASSHDGEDGPRHSMTMRMHKADAQAEDRGIRGAVEDAMKGDKK